MTCGTGGGMCTNCGTTGDGCSTTGGCTCGGGAACGTGQVCSGGKCVCDATSCPTGCCLGGTTCEPGDTTSACGPAGGTCAVCATGDTCNAGMCVALPPVCGDGVRETGEQCDDGNLVDLDGCDSTCKFEQITRATQLVIQWAHDTFCTKDVLFEAVQNPAIGNVHSTLQGDLNTDVTNGSDNVILKYFAITDLTGQSGTATVGSYNALAATYTTPYSGNSDLDWWYTLDTTTAGGSPLYTPTAKESAGTFTAGVLNATGGHVLVSAFGTSLLDLANVKMQLPIGTPATKPTVSTGAAPGHLASENLDPTLTSFSTAGGTNAAPTGLLCGDTTAASLAATQVPSQLQSNCSQNFTSANNLLDVFVDGCSALIVGSIINAVQPDQINPDATPAGAGGPYTFQLTGNHVTGCKDKNGTTVTPYTDCLAPAAYSSYLKMALDRVILKHP
jgi:cysteine-rich repeat protein